MYTLVLVLSVTTMVVGLIGAIGQSDFRRVLSFNLVGHIGFTTIGLALGTSAALGASILYMLHHMLVITSLFLISGWFLRQRRTTNLSALGACTERSRRSRLWRWCPCSRSPVSLRCRDSLASLP